MFSVALIGADGCGKTTIARSLAGDLPFASRYVYMGVSLESANWMLPTTWAWRQWKRLSGQSGYHGPPSLTRPAKPKGWLKRCVKSIKSTFGFAHRTLEQVFRHVVAGSMKRLGFVVIFDRHYFIDYYTYDVLGAQRTFLQKVHGWLLTKVFPRPDIVILLDAPSEVLQARKGEGTIEELDARLSQYHLLKKVCPNFIELDATVPLEKVRHAVVAQIKGFRDHGDDSGN